MMFMDCFLFMHLFLISCLLYGVSFKHVLMTLLSLEFAVLNAFMEIYFCYDLTFGTFVVVYYLVFAVCESILGLSMLVMMVRWSGTDYSDSVNVLQW